MALDTFTTYGYHNWGVTVTARKRSVAACNYRDKQVELSSEWFPQMTDAEIVDTVLHEVAHALAGPNVQAHGREWKRVARAIGCDASTTFHANGRNLNDRAPWRGVCPNGHETYMFRAPQRVKTCAQCSSRPNPQYMFEWTKHGSSVPMSAKYTAERQRMQQRMGV